MTTDACREFESRLARAADGALEAGEQATLDAHLAACAACRAALAGQRDVRAALTARPPLRAQADFAARVAAAIDAERPWADWLDFRAWTWRLVPVAAALSLVTWVVLQTAPAADPASSSPDAALNSELPVAAALWDESVSDASLLSLMLRASANDKLADSLKER